MFATGSSDKCLKIWKRKLRNCDSNSPDLFDNDLDDPFENADRNGDYAHEDEEMHLISSNEESKRPNNEQKPHQVTRSQTAGAS